jgi:hypothetical protein
MENSLQPPRLSSGQYSLLQVDTNTGHILQTNGDLFVGDGETFKLFNDLSKVHEFVESQIKKNDTLEFVVYDCHGKGILLINKFQKEELK